ncbi:MAG: AzlC family ABC transporter permease [Ilumatobacter sp.]|jgi:predicted branched-subunit amino acid permease|uniref:AzlC family ABC transporter permease n=1 Tax=Ilumatobacter sp. TaxID=1967498 RepID=UPI003919B84C
MSTADPGSEHTGRDTGGDAGGGTRCGTDESRIRRRIHRQAASITAAVAPFAIVFGAAAATAGLSLLETIGFSVFVFGGSSQFAAVEILGDGGSIASAALAGLLLNVRSLAFGVIMAPALVGAFWQRAAMSQLMIDEATAIGTSSDELRWRRYGFLVGGLSVFAVWNLLTIAGFVVFDEAGELITDLGLDVAGPAAFLALLWPRLVHRPQLIVAVVGAAIAVVLTPFAPAGVPILASMLAALAVWSPRGALATPDHDAAGAEDE